MTPPDAIACRKHPAPKATSPINRATIAHPNPQYATTTGPYATPQPKQNPG
jgi:hypothetical protein